MKKSLYQPRPRSDVTLNMTAMIDVIFILITFFMLICRSIGQENYKLEIPDECVSAVVPDQPDQAALTVSVFPRAALLTSEAPLSAVAPEAEIEVLYAVRARTFDPLNLTYQQNPDLLVRQLSEQIERQGRQKSDSLVHLRADKYLTYGQVQPVLLALARARVKTIQLAVHRRQADTNRKME